MANQMLLDYEEAKERKDYQLAIQQLEKLIEIFPNDKHYYELLLGYALGLKDPKINEYATRLLQVDPHNQIASFALLMKENNWADPQRVLELKNLFENLSPDSNDPFVQRARAIFLINMATLPPNLELMDSVLNEFAGFENDADLGPKFKTMRQLRNVMIEFKQLPDFSNAVNSFVLCLFIVKYCPIYLELNKETFFQKKYCLMLINIL
ncbi:MAG: hypothetical protein HWD59_10645 [Coxiellaceae bacterium]|nr:MAG: hypothetical protein HWD59_10645 [Coxiellaceae bacterium]